MPSDRSPARATARTASAPRDACAFIRIAEHRFRANELTRGPWHPDHQHAGPPIALVAGEIERAAAALGYSHLARITASLFRPIPIGELAIEVAIEYQGKNFAHCSARLTDGDKELARFSALCRREATIELPSDLPGNPLPQAPRAPEASPPERFPFSETLAGYADLIESRVASGKLFGGPCAVWFRLRFPLVAGETPSGAQRVAVAADSANGVSAVLDRAHYVFVNSDLTVNLLRPARGEWICLDARTALDSNGGGLAAARIFDRDGFLGRCTQTLAVRRRD